MKRLLLLKILSFLIAGLFAQDYAISRSVISPFVQSENFLSAGFKVSHSLGEVATKSMKNNNESQKVTQGFQQPDCIGEDCDPDPVTLCSEVSIQNIITPNGDKRNDVWNINEFGPEASISINLYNRWGVNVLTRNNYQNDWGGDNLPEGTYYYVLKIDQEKPCKGSLVILR